MPMRYPPLTLSIIAGIGVAACADTTPPSGPAETPPADLGLFGDGYPLPGDPCRRAGETGFTNRFLDDAADLVACPAGPAADALAGLSGARETARLEGWILYSIARR